MLCYVMLCYVMSLENTIEHSQMRVHEKRSTAFKIFIYVKLILAQFWQLNCGNGMDDEHMRKRGSTMKKGTARKYNRLLVNLHCTSLCMGLDLDNNVPE